MESITAEEILKQIEKMESASSDGFTTEEMSECIGFGLKTTRDRLKKMIRSGLAHYVGRRSIPDMTGRMQQAPVYQLNKKGKK